jgi:hypothetical protein
MTFFIAQMKKGGRAAQGFYPYQWFQRKPGCTFLSAVVLPSPPPSETVVYLSRWKAPLWMLWFACLSVGIAAALVYASPPAFAASAIKHWLGYIFGWLMAAGFGFYAGQYAVQLWRNRPVFRLGVLGIQLGTAPLAPWARIWQEEVVVNGGRNRTVVLSYRTPHGIQRQDITDCGITAARLHELLLYYRQHALSGSTVSR